MLQGERPMAKDNVSLGRIMLEGFRLLQEAFPR
jgi:molecular chaperone DnaK (HSP70)